MSEADTLDALIASLLRGGAAASPSPLAADEQRLLKMAEYHGVVPLLHKGTGAWSAANRRHLHEGFRRQAATELQRQGDLRRFLATLVERGGEALLLKGAALAYTLYPDPALRSRADADLLVPEEHKALAEQALVDLGYRPENTITGRWVTYERSYRRPDAAGEQCVDLHWRISNAQIFARALGYEELRADSQPVPALGPHARALSTSHALLHACMHRVGHRFSPYFVGETAYYGGDRLIWLYDMHLLAGAMNAPKWVEFTRLARDRRLGAVCADGLRSMARSFGGSNLPGDVLRALDAAAERREPSAAYFSSSALRRTWADLRALPRWSHRAALLREHLFPPADYMRKKFGARSAWVLPVLYARRLMGAAKMLRASPR